jgi:serine/threonine protein kinase
MYRRHQDTTLTSLTSRSLNQSVSQSKATALSLLQAEFDRHSVAAQHFPPIISSDILRSAINNFEQTLVRRSQQDVCASCGIFCPTSEIRRLPENNDCLHDLTRAGLDKCGFHDGCWSFCTACYNDILKHKTPKFSALNSVNMITCDRYPPELEDLTFVEECAVARRHPIGAILKLRPGNRRSPNNYYALSGHMIVVPQNPGPLLQILPSPELRFQDIVKVFWIGKCAPSTTDLKPFLVIRKKRVLSALQWLIEHHCHYHDITVNHSLLSSWPDEFIPEQISANITSMLTSDHSEREGYIANLQSNNFENDLQAVANDMSSDDSTVFTSGSLCTDLDGNRVNEDLHLLETLASFVDGERTDPNVTETDPVDDDNYIIDYDSDSPLEDSIPSDTSIRDPVRGTERAPYIRYSFAHSPATLSSSWSDPSFFTTAFPTLFPTGLGGHLDDRPVKVSLELLARWALSHHSRR